MASRASREEWEARIAAWRASGQSAEAFASGRGLKPGTLRWWSSHLRRRGASASKPKVDFARVVAKSARDEGRGETGIELILPSGCRVRVAPGFDAATLRAVVDALRGRP
jgi:hypothetical protein